MYNTDDYSLPRLAMDNCICQPAAFWRNRIAKIVGPFNTNLNFVMDYDYWLRIAVAGGKIVHLPDILANSRLYPETKTLSAREEIFAEILSISKKHIGYVHVNYFIGLWNHRVWERKTGIYRYFRYIPRSFIILANLHYFFFNFSYLKKKASLAWFKQQIRFLLKSTLGFLRPLIRKIRSRRFLVTQNKAVFGLWPDNWLGPVFQVYIKRKNPGQILYLTGIPKQDTYLNVKIESTAAIHHKLEAGRAICLEVPAESGQRVLFEFSQPFKDETGRYITLLVTDTNLFIEQDVIYE